MLLGLCVSGHKSVVFVLQFGVHKPGDNLVSKQQALSILDELVDFEVVPQSFNFVFGRDLVIDERF
jgi:hypothetical protein